MRGRFNLDYQDALTERTSQRKHMPGTQLINWIKSDDKVEKALILIPSVCSSSEQGNSSTQIYRVPDRVYASTSLQNNSLVSTRGFSC